jgi:hypothetical protein
MSTAQAGEGVCSWKRNNCPRPTYPHCYYWAPAFWKFNAGLYPPVDYTYAKDLHPEIPLHYEPIILPCPAVPPDLYPFPPAELPLPMAMTPPQPKAPE